jgi:uncharacterized protein (TIGR02147 family)
MKSVFEYLDYRSFLKDFYEEKKTRQSFFSYRLFGAKVGVDASYLVKVFIKSRHISDKSIPKFAGFCGLGAKETEYFEALVHFAKARSHKESKLYFEKLLSVKSLNANVLLAHQYEYYRKWYHSAIRSVLEYYEFRDDFKALGEKLSPAISAKEAKESVLVLEKLGLIRRDGNGIYRITESAISTGDLWNSLAIQAFQEETIRLSLESLSRHPKRLRDVSTVTMNINEHDFEEIRERVGEFRGRVIKYVNEAVSPDRTYQMNIQLFPLTKTQGRAT